MAEQIVLAGVNKHFGSFNVLKDINLSVEKGSFVALVGPSGCGKTTLLRSIAGLEKITSGEIFIAGERVNARPPRLRDVAMVFQSYALYPHMTVEENLAYSLKVRGVSRSARRKAAEEVAATTGLSDLLHRYPGELSGGQRQRVAMSRAIIRNPKAFLFDEPLSNLDAALRVQMRKEIRALHERLDATSLYVTHDQIEALTMADQVVVLRDGVIEQKGKPLELYDRPTNRFVAGFIGSPAMNFIAARVAEGGLSFDLGAGPIHIALPVAAPIGTEVLMGLRPEHLVPTVVRTGRFTVPVALTEFTGSITFLTTATTPELNVLYTGRLTLFSGDRVGLDFRDADVHLFTADGTRRL